VLTNGVINMLGKSKKEEILELRNRGYGYKSIAVIAGVKRDTVRGLCKSWGLEGCLGFGLSREPEKKSVFLEHITNCLYCYKEINIEDRRGRKSKFCSDQCRRKWWYANQDRKNRKDSAWYHFICLYCGKDFKAYGNKNRKFCSRRCVADYRFGSHKEKTGYEKRKELEGGTTQNE